MCPCEGTGPLSKVLNKSKLLLIVADGLRRLLVESPLISPSNC